MRLASISLETLIGLFVGLFPGLIQMSWEFRALGLVFAIVLAVHIAGRLEVSRLSKIAIRTIAIGMLLDGTWLPIWIGFHADFPDITRETAVARIIEFCAVAACGIAVYVFLIRPQGRKGYRVLPAQVITVGICMVGAGFLTALIGLGWQYQQNWAAGISPSGAPTFTIGRPQITQASPPPALPPPQHPPEPTPYFSQSQYNLTGSGITALADELYKVRGTLKTIQLDRMQTDGTANPFIDSFERSCDQAGINCPVVDVHPNSPDERGLMIYVADPSKPPEPAQELKTTLSKLGIDVPFVARPGLKEADFSLFVGPRL
jgi:hypothetical protein